MSKDFTTIDNDSGSALCKTVIHDGDEYELPVDYSFESINNYVHNIDRQYEELQYLALGMASHGDRLREQLAIAVGALKYYADGEHIRHLSNGDCVFEYGDQAQQALAQIREMGDV